MNEHANRVAAVQQRIATIFEASVNLQVPAVESDLFDTGVLDSVTFVDLLLHLEREFGVKCSLEDLDLENFRSIGRIADFICSSGAAKGCAA
jgi:methoxymalonate biosynthesis acyl carrier protein